MKLLNLYKRLFQRTILSCLVLLTAGACNRDLLDTVPETSISNANAFDNPQRILAQVNGLYSSVKSAQFYGGRYIIYNELRADEFIMNKPNVQTCQLTWAQTVNSSTSEVQNLWSAAYASINRIHIFLEGLEANKSKVDAALYTNYVAEGKFLRALCYFALVQTYARPYIENKGAGAGLPLRLSAESSAQNNNLERSSVAKVYEQILSDLNAAEQGLPLTYGVAATNATRAHRNTAIALKTRVYLVMGDFPGVIAEAGKIVSETTPFQASAGVNNKLEANIVNVFSGTYTGAEAILSLPMSALDAPGGQNALAYYFTFSPGNAEYYLNAAGTLANPVFAASSTDARKNLIATQQGMQWLYKYKVAGTYSDYIPVIRYAEVLLNYAEAAARVGGAGNLLKAAALLAAVRNRSDAAYAFYPAAVTGTDALVNTILEERKVELLGEGFRVPDLLRNMKPLPAKTGPAGGSPLVAVNESKYIWPISAAEMSVNSLMTPNP